MKIGIYTALSCAVGLLMFSQTYAASITVPSAEASTISEAMIHARRGDTIWVERGVYREHVLMAPGVALISRSLFGAVIDGGGKGTVVTMGRNNIISGFEIKNGTIGIFSDGPGVEIRDCRIVNNWQTGIITVRHLPVIEDNIIAFNRGSGIQGWDVRTTASSINHNSIAFNGNHGIALGGNSEVIIENNVVAYNERFGLKVLDHEENVQVVDNNFYRNLYSPHPYPPGNFSFDPAFIAPRTSMNFKSDPTLCCKTKSSDNEDLGARLNY
ncbi:right-handed parallel beta-helix repeat-containing protein [Chitinispirillales bacterium ANBcel5]|uniref:right-handed parallel beta-helix repeat-containing protein n=1 Tax=Cellulosispirillum alkaliphilum TaxID=3039283 RepID=UPI002A50CC76|nr:right-handed parallel beta-helix repeat-containing protein [Chitinispirillales bacterium ANBcel5]